MLTAERHKPKRPETTKVHSQAVQRVIKTVRSRLDEHISLKEMAGLAYMSSFHFNRAFRGITGLPPRRFLSALRVQSATNMLLDTDHSVTDICFDVGYNSLGTFIRRFSEVLGVSPRRLRSMRHSLPKNLLQSVGPNASVTPVSVEAILTGRIQAPESFSGPIFLGLFATAIPEGVPRACAIQYSPGVFRMAGVPRGVHYLFAVGLPWPTSIRDYFRHDSALRGGGQLVSVDRDIVECEEVRLRPAMPTDPPILVNLPVLLGKTGNVRKAA